LNGTIANDLEGHLCHLKPFERVPELFLVLFRPGTTSVWSGRGTFFVSKPEHAKHFHCS